MNDCANIKFSTHPRLFLLCNPLARGTCTSTEFSDLLWIFLPLKSFSWWVLPPCTPNVTDILEWSSPLQNQLEPSHAAHGLENWLPPRSIPRIIWTRGRRNKPLFFCQNFKYQMGDTHDYCLDLSKFQISNGGHSWLLSWSVKISNIKWGVLMITVLMHTIPPSWKACFITGVTKAANKGF